MLTAIHYAPLVAAVSLLHLAPVFQYKLFFLQVQLTAAAAFLRQLAANRCRQINNSVPCYETPLSVQFSSAKQW